MNENIELINQEIESTIELIQQNIKSKNYTILNQQIEKLRKLILDYILNLDYEFKNDPNIDKESYKNFLQIKETINLNIQKISEYLKNPSENLIQEISTTINQIYNTLYSSEEKVLQERWADDQERLFFTIFNQISELSNKVYNYYWKKEIYKDEIKKIAQSLLKNIELLP